MAMTGALMGMVMGVIVAVEMLMVVGMRMVMVMDVVMGVGMGHAVVGMLVGMGMGMVMGMTAHVIVMFVHYDCSFAFFFYYIGKPPDCQMERAAPPLCKGRCQKSLISDGGADNPPVSFADSPSPR